MRYALALLVAVALFCAAPAQAAGDNNMAGCGLGGMFVSSDSNGPQAFALTTNGSSYSNWFGITSGTSGCSSQGWWSAQRERRERYVKANFGDLTRELAQGRGEYAVSFASVMGCTGDAVPAFLSFTKGNYGKVISSEKTTPSELINNLEREIAANKTLSQVCTL